MAYDFVNNAQDLISRLHYPRREDFMTTWWYSEGKVAAKQIGNNIPEYYLCDTHGETVTTKALNEDFPVCEKSVDEEAYKSAKVVYSVELDIINESFEVDLARYLGIKRSHPKFNTLMRLAREYASGSLNTVVEVAEDLIDLLD